MTYRTSDFIYYVSMLVRFPVAAASPPQHASRCSESALLTSDRKWGHYEDQRQVLDGHRSSILGPVSVFDVKTLLISRDEDPAFP